MMGEMRMTFTDEEWTPAADTLDVVRKISAAAKAGQLKGALNIESEPGRKLALLLKELVDNHEKIPVAVKAEAL